MEQERPGNGRQSVHPQRGNEGNDAFSLEATDVLRSGVPQRTLCHTDGSRRDGDNSAGPAAQLTPKVGRTLKPGCALTLLCVAEGVWHPRGDLCCPSASQSVRAGDGMWRPGPAGRAAGGLGPGAMTARGTGPGHTCGKRGEPAVSSVHLLTHTDTHRSRFLVCSTKHKSIFALNGPPLLHNFSSALPQGFGRYVSHCHADTPRSTLHAFTPSYKNVDLSPASPC